MVAVLGFWVFVAVIADLMYKIVIVYHVRRNLRFLNKALCPKKSCLGVLVAVIADLMYKIVFSAFSS